jgi:hypothetical protein
VYAHAILSPKGEAFKYPVLGDIIPKGEELSTLPALSIVGLGFTPEFVN